MGLSKRIKLYFFGNFASDNFAYVLYPFLFVFKIFGFAPIKLKNGEIFNESQNIEICRKTWIIGILDMVLYVVGFILGVNHLSETHRWLRHHEDTIIAFYTSWTQIISVFIIGAVAVISSWTRLKDMQSLCQAIFQIDRQFKAIDGIKIDYKQLRRRLFIEFIIAFIIPISFSMVICTIIQSFGDEFVFSPSCFWFICFTPILLLTFKEFQFCNLLYILKLKLELVNNKLNTYSIDRQTQNHSVVEDKRQRFTQVGNGDSISGIPLTMLQSFDSNGDGCSPIQRGDVLLSEDRPTVESLRNLLRAYSKIADAVHLLLEIFSLHLVLLTTVSIGIIIIQCYNLFALLVKALHMQTYQIVFVIAWVVVQMTVIGVNIGVCSSTFKTMSKTGLILHQIRWPSASDADNANEFYHVIQIFSLEVLQRKQVISAGGFFDMDYKLITSIIASVTTYLVIIIQFHQCALSTNEK